MCSDCHDAAEDIVAIRILLREAANAPAAGPWFAPRVMAAIASQEAELSRGAAIWLAVPRFAARLAWIAAAALVFTCTWLYERPVPQPPQTASVYASEHLFDPPTLPPNHDDVLVSANEKDQ
jgi:negative regulator of sigma E activity